MESERERGRGGERPQHKHAQWTLLELASSPGPPSMLKTDLRINSIVYRPNTTNCINLEEVEDIHI
jgi:hypothetical protein